MAVSRNPESPLPRTLLGKALWVLRHRPLGFLPSLRGFVLFRVTEIFKPLILKAPAVQLGKNVRLQRLRCIHAELPSAQVRIGDHSVIYERAEVSAFGQGIIDIGEYAVLGDIRISCRQSITIGKRFISSWNVFIQDFDPHPVDPDQRGQQVRAICAGFRPRFAPVEGPERYAWEFPGSPVRIGDDVWIGANCTILKGARIGNGCIVATGAVVLSGDYPDRSIIAGNPARVVKTLD